MCIFVGASQCANETCKGFAENPPKPLRLNNAKQPWKPWLARAFALFSTHYNKCWGEWKKEFSFKYRGSFCALLILKLCVWPRRQARQGCYFLALRAQGAAHCKPISTFSINNVYRSIALARGDFVLIFCRGAENPHRSFDPSLTARVHSFWHYRPPRRL